MHARHPILTRFLSILTGALIAAAFTACGGYGGSNYSSGGGGGGMTCGTGYAVQCPAPTVTITDPAAGNVSGTVALTATATASATYNLTIASVEFFVDNASVGTAMASPYTVMWDSTKVANGSHTITAKATDSKADVGTSAAVVVTVGNAAMAAAMSASQIFPAPMSQASGVARLLVDRETGAASGRVTLSGLSARTVTINQGFAGSTGEALITLAPRANSASEWDVPANVQLTAEQMSALAQGRLYVIATSGAHPNGEIRGQLAPENVRVSFSDLTASPVAVDRGMAASGVAATTVDTSAGTLTVHVNSSGVDGAVGAQVTGSARLAELARDGVDTAHWSVELARIRAADVADFRAGRLSVSVATQAAPDGAIRGQIRPEN